MVNSTHSQAAPVATPSAGLIDLNAHPPRKSKFMEWKDSVLDKVAAKIPIVAEWRKKLDTDDDEVDEATRMQEEADKQLELMQLDKYILLPDSPFRLYWDMVMMVMVLYYGFTVPIKIAFDDETSEDPSTTSLAFIFDQFSNVFFIVDIVLNFFTAIKVDGVLVAKKKEIWKNYLLSWFPIDMVSSFPSEWVTAGSEATGTASINKLLRLMKIFKLFRVFRVARILKQLEEFTKFNPAVLRLFKLIFFLAYVWHLIGCSYWGVASLAEDFAAAEPYFYRDGQNNWIPSPELWCTLKKRREDFIPACMELPEQCFYSNNTLCPAPWEMQYVNSFFWAVMATTGIGRDIAPATFTEHIFSAVMIGVGVLLYAVIIGSASSALSNLDSGNAERRQKLDSINQYLRQRGVPNDLQKRIRAYYDYMWSSHQSLSEKGGVLNDLHPSLQLELHISLNRKLIENVPMFKMITDSECLIDMIEKLTPKIYIPGEYVVLQYEVGSEMYVIVRGLVHVLVGEDRKHVATLKDGDVFGEHALITRTTRNASVKAVTYCDTLVLSKEDFDEVMISYPEFFTNLQRLALGKLNKGWSRVSQTLKMASAIRIFGGEVNIRELLLGKAKTKSALEDVDAAVKKKTANRK